MPKGVVTLSEIDRRFSRVLVVYILLQPHAEIDTPQHRSIANVRVREGGEGQGSQFHTDDGQQRRAE